MGVSVVTPLLELAAVAPPSRRHEVPAIGVVVVGRPAVVPGSLLLEVVCCVSPDVDCLLFPLQPTTDILPSSSLSLVPRRAHFSLLPLLSLSVDEAKREDGAEGAGVCVRACVCEKK